MRYLLLIITTALMLPLLIQTPVSSGMVTDNLVGSVDNPTHLVIVFMDGTQQSFAVNQIARMEFRGDTGIDTIVGTWAWSVPGWTVRFLPDGTVQSSSANDSNSGTWRVIASNPRKYEIRWVKGGWIDSLGLSSDGQRLAGSNQRGNPVSATRK